MGAVQPDQPGQAVLPAADRQGLEVGAVGMGWAGMTAARASRRTNSSTTAPDLAVRTRHSSARYPWARLSALLAKSAADWPETSRTGTRSTYRVAVTLTSTGRMIRPR